MLPQFQLAVHTCIHSRTLTIQLLRPLRSGFPWPFQSITSCDNKFGARDPKCRLFLTRYVYCNILDRLFDIATAMAATPIQADQQNAANTREILRARQAVENREEEGCVYSIPLSD